MLNALILIIVIYIDSLVGGNLVLLSVAIFSFLIFFSYRTFKPLYPIFVTLAVIFLAVRTNIYYFNSLYSLFYYLGSFSLGVLLYCYSRHNGLELKRFVSLSVYVILFFIGIELFVNDIVVRQFGYDHVFLVKSFFNNPKRLGEFCVFLSILTFIFTGSSKILFVLTLIALVSGARDSFLITFIIFVSNFIMLRKNSFLPLLLLSIASFLIFINFSLLPLELQYRLFGGDYFYQRIISLFPIPFLDLTLQSVFYGRFLGFYGRELFVLDAASFDYFNSLSQFFAESTFVGLSSYIQPFGPHDSSLVKLSSDFGIFFAYLFIILIFLLLIFRSFNARLIRYNISLLLVLLLLLKAHVYLSSIFIFSLFVFLVISLIRSSNEFHRL